MNVLDKLITKQEKHAEQLTILEQLVLACNDPQKKLQAAAELHELQAGGQIYSDRQDMTELKNRSV